MNLEKRAPADSNLRPRLRRPVINPPELQTRQPAARSAQAAVSRTNTVDRGPVGPHVYAARIARLAEIVRLVSYLFNAPAGRRLQRTALPTTSTAREIPGVGEFYWSPYVGPRFVVVCQRWVRVWVHEMRLGNGSGP